MKHFTVAIALTTALMLACQKVPITGRKQLMLFNSKELLPMSFTNYRGVLDTSRVLKNGTQAQLVRRVGLRIQKSVEDYMIANGYGKLLDGFQWEFNTIESRMVNAWCMPGGKVVFYTGILPICEDEAGIAVVMGHEVSHAIASHGAERMSQGMMAQYGMVAGQTTLGIAMANKPQQTQNMYAGLFGLAAPIAANVGYILPNSRNQESEADQLGLKFMAMAGYDPSTAPEFWRRMSKLGGGQKPPQFLSTHPADETRVAALERQLPAAAELYNKALPTVGKAPNQRVDATQIDNTATDYGVPEMGGSLRGNGVKKKKN